MRRGGRDSRFGIGIGDLGLWRVEGGGKCSRLWVEDWRLKMRG